MPSEKSKKKIIKRIFLKCSIIILLACLVCAPFYYFTFIFIGLPSDEKMIAHFYKNRQDIETLVNSFRYFEPEDDGSHYMPWFNTASTQPLMARAGVCNIGTIIPTWYPNPYSKEAAQERYAKGPTGVLYHYPYKTIKINLSPFNQYRTDKLLYGWIWKDLVYIPEIPRIENGVLLGPVDENGEHLNNDYVLDSLDNIPPQWEAFNLYKNSCVLRQIEAHWFLMLCHGG
ncbi:hypothetical protein RHO13_02125 [Orbus wheelerorum]|uniref:hypothetical protein n=1 Tax=Orbus wheelerorum TaxID=3074111 RepID=UPI00370D8051